MRAISTCCSRFRRLAGDRSGSVGTEYSFLIVFIALAFAGAATALGISFKDFFAETSSGFKVASEKLPNATAGPGSGNPGRGGGGGAAAGEGGVGGVDAGGAGTGYGGDNDNEDDDEEDAEDDTDG